MRNICFYRHSWVFCGLTIFIKVSFLVSLFWKRVFFSAGGLCQKGRSSRRYKHKWHNFRHETATGRRLLCSGSMFPALCWGARRRLSVPFLTLFVTFFKEFVWTCGKYDHDSNHSILCCISCGHMQYFIYRKMLVCSFYYTLNMSEIFKKWLYELSWDIGSCSRFTTFLHPFNFLTL